MQLPERSCGEGCCEESRSSVEDGSHLYRYTLSGQRIRTLERITWPPKCHQKCQTWRHLSEAQRPPQPAPPLPHPPAAGLGLSIHPGNSQEKQEKEDKEGAASVAQSVRRLGWEAEDSWFKPQHGPEPHHQGAPKQGKHTPHAHPQDEWVQIQTTAKLLVHFAFNKKKTKIKISK